MDIDQDKLDRTLRESSEANKRSDEQPVRSVESIMAAAMAAHRRLTGGVVLDDIPKEEHANVISCFWQMMRELEEQARNTKSRLDEIAVEGYYRLWNRITNDNKQPAWMEKK